MAADLRRSEPEFAAISALHLAAVLHRLQRHQASLRLLESTQPMLDASGGSAMQGGGSSAFLPGGRRRAHLQAVCWHNMAVQQLLFGRVRSPRFPRNVHFDRFQQTHPYGNPWVFQAVEASECCERAIEDFRKPSHVRDQPPCCHRRLAIHQLLLVQLLQHRPACGISYLAFTLTGTMWCAVLPGGAAARSRKVRGQTVSTVAMDHWAAQCVWFHPSRVSSSASTSSCREAELLYSSQIEVTWLAAQLLSEERPSSVRAPLLRLKCSSSTAHRSALTTRAGLPTTSIHVLPCEQPVQAVQRCLSPLRDTLPTTAQLAELPRSPVC